MTSAKLFTIVALFALMLVASHVCKGLIVCRDAPCAGGPR